jgi:UDP-GlcNAc3NAcA epimerase
VKIASIVGARPQFVKAAVVSRAISATEGMQEVLIHTGQHYDPELSDIFFEELEIPSPDYHLGVGSASHARQTAQMLEGLEPLFVEEAPAVILVYGDTNSTLAGALAAAKLQLPVAHIEAGLRSFNRRMPEEINRIVADHLSTVLFAPTAVAVANLKAEGFSEQAIALVGDVMYDAAMFYEPRAERRRSLIEDLGLTAGHFALATIHRAANTDDAARLATIVEALDRLAGDMRVVFPIHPRTREALERSGLLDLAGRAVTLIAPVGYLDMVQLEHGAALVLTDSGGVQKEAFFYRIPCVTLRDETEWTELVELGWNHLAPPVDADTIVATARRALATRGSDSSPYGDGNAAQLIVERLAVTFTGGAR